MLSKSQLSDLEETNKPKETLETKKKVLGQVESNSSKNQKVLTYFCCYLADTIKICLCFISIVIIN